jgi:divalent metal cation (Fe/Co/Zn/Cd) transporter
MRPRAPYALPAEQGGQMKRAVRLQWLTIATQSTVIALMALVMGSSQAMRSAWIEDTLSLIPPTAFLIAARVRRIAPDESYPYGRHRVISISFLVTAITLFSFGLLLLGDSLATLLQGEHPTIGYFWLAGHQVWQGWVMIVVLVYTMVPPVLLGRAKLPLARALHAKVLHADASMNKADWMTAVAAITGIVGISLGLWWADAAVAGVISWSVLADGARALRTVTGDLMDHSPRPVDDQEQFDVVARLDRYLDGLAWVQRHELRLREEGDVCVGEAFLVPRHDTPDLTQKMEQVAADARALDWRLYDLVVTPVSALPAVRPAAD